MLQNFAERCSVCRILLLLFLFNHLVFSMNAAFACHCPKDFIPIGPAKPCVHDGDCEEGEKCCVYDRNPICAPAFFPDQGCPLTNGLNGLCAELCSSDSECSVGEMCCFNGCGHQCMSTVPVKSGCCGPQVFTPWCYSFCGHDSDCSGEKKCCPTTCGRVCKDPIFLRTC
uniref:WAP four-disulfide core domain 2 n=1 Tax=Fundulus heteroclitus TaxID=8078 RepID=A0A3Q2UIR4_FUNHE